MNKEKVKTISLALLFFLLTSPAFAAYLEKYPPFDPKSPPFKSPSINKELMPWKDGVLKDGDIEIKEYNPQFDPPRFATYSIVEMRKNGQLIFKFNGDEEYPVIWNVDYWDIDQNGLKDLVIGAGYMGNSLGAFDHRGIIFLQTQDGVFKQLNYKTMFYGPEDFIDVNKDGKYEIMTMHLYQDDGIDGKPHSFWVYNLYAFDGEDLVLANDLSPIFPKFIWFTHKTNDKETDKLTKEQKTKYIASLPQRIKAIAPQVQAA